MKTLVISYLYLDVPEDKYVGDTVTVTLSDEDAEKLLEDQRRFDFEVRVFAPVVEA